MEKSKKRLMIEQKQKELQVAGLQNKLMQFDIKILELEEEIERIENNKRLSQEALNKILNPVVESKSEETEQEGDH